MSTRPNRSWTAGYESAMDRIRAADERARAAVARAEAAEARADVQERRAVTAEVALRLATTERDALQARIDAAAAVCQESDAKEWTRAFTVSKIEHALGRASTPTETGAAT